MGKARALSTGCAVCVCVGGGAIRLDPGWPCPRMLWDSQALRWGANVTRQLQSVVRSGGLTAVVNEPPKCPMSDVTSVCSSFAGVPEGVALVAPLRRVLQSRSLHPFGAPESPCPPSSRQWAPKP